jgi:hypothetical protein
VCLSHVKYHPRFCNSSFVKERSFCIKFWSTNGKMHKKRTRRTWIYCHEPEIEKHCFQWKNPPSPLPKKMGAVSSKLSRGCTRHFVTVTAILIGNFLLQTKRLTRIANMTSSTTAELEMIDSPRQCVGAHSVGQCSHVWATKNMADVPNTSFAWFGHLRFLLFSAKMKSQLRRHRFRNIPEIQKQSLRPFHARFQKVSSSCT